MCASPELVPKSCGRAPTEHIPPSVAEQRDKLAEVLGRFLYPTWLRQRRLATYDPGHSTEPNPKG